MAKIHVKGKEQHPLYAALTSKDAGIPGPTGDIDWNFAKFVIGRDGKIKDVIVGYDNGDHRLEDALAKLGATPPAS